MKLIIALTLLAFVNGKEFMVKDKNNATCLLLTLEGSLDLAAFDGTTSLGNKSLDFTGASVLNDSDCSVIKLDLTSSAQVWFQLDKSSSDMKAVPVSTFDPITVFGDKVNETDSPVYQATPLGTFTQGQSWACIASVSHDFTLQGNKTRYNFTVQAKTSQFQVQFGSIQNDSFSSGPHCSEDSTTTPTPTTSPATTATPTTAPPSVPVNDYNVTNQYNNVTCIKVESGLKVQVTYLAGKVNKTYAAVVPKSASATGNCNVNANTSNIVIGFDAGTGDEWMLTYTFTTADKGTSYFVSQVDLTYSNLPDASVKTPVTATAKFTSDYLKATGSGYYLCNADQTITLGEAEVTSNDFKYKAFYEKDDKIDFSGDVAECTADEETSSVVPIAVGAALAGLVVIVLVAYLIGRRRSRKSGYESV